MIDRNRIRLKVDDGWPYDQLVNELSNTSPELPRGRAARFEIGIFSGGEWQTDVSDITSLTLEIKTRSAKTGAPLASHTEGVLAAGVSVNEWNNKTNQHAVIEFTQAELALAMGGAESIDLWIVITAETASGSITLAAGNATMIEDGGLSSADTPGPGDPQYFNKEQIIAMLAALQANGDKIIDSPGGVFRRRLSVTDDGQQIDVTTRL